MNVTALRLRGILDSRARATVEAEVALGEVWGRGSCPVAIAPGRLERPRRLRTGTLGDLTGGATGAVLRRALVGRAPGGQRELDALLADLDRRERLGADVTLAISLAYARAASAAARVRLYRWFADLAGTAPRLPRLLVNAFSGGIHQAGPAASFQQVMVVPHTADLAADVRAAVDVHEALRRRLTETFGDVGLSASSGFLAPARAGVEWQLSTLAEVAGRLGQGRMALAVDVAAEHLAAPPRGYRFGQLVLAPDEFGQALLRLAAEYGVAYIEDPFDPADTDAWRRLRPAARSAGVTLVGDDLFASEAARVDAALADAVLLKPSQAGTVTATLDAAVAARRAGMQLVASHRSGETEDTAICDLAVALGAELIKLGGPLRGDRIAKYNELLRLAENGDVEAAPPPRRLPAARHGRDRGRSPETADDEETVP